MMLRLVLVVAAARALSPTARARTIARAGGDYMDTLGGGDAAPAAPAAPKQTPEASAALFKAEAGNPNLSESVLGDFAARSERNLEVARLQTQLERSQLRRKQVEEVVGEELAALRYQLEREVEAENDRRAAARGLRDRLAEARAAKEANCAREETLLVQLQDVAQRTSEDVIAASLASAIETKAGLVAIDRLLIEDIAECDARVAAEEAEIERRIAAMRATTASLPAAGDADASRLYSWSQVEALQAELARGAEEIAATEASIAALRSRINDALDQRDAVLGSAPVGAAAGAAGAGAAAAAAPKASPRSAITSLDLESLDEAGLKDAVSSSAAATVSAFAALGKNVLAFGGALRASDDRAAASKLLAEAGDASREATSALRESGGADMAETDAAQLAKATASSLAKSASSLGGAAAKTAEAAAKAADASDLGASAVDAATALGNTAASAGLLAFKAIKSKLPKE